jgi:hypothetical protein
LLLLLFVFPFPCCCCCSFFFFRCCGSSTHTLPFLRSPTNLRWRKIRLPYDIEWIDGLPYTGNNRLPYEIESIDGPETYVPTVMGLKQRFNRT